MLKLALGWQKNICQTLVLREEIFFSKLCGCWWLIAPFLDRMLLLAPSFVGKTRRTWIQCRSNKVLQKKQNTVPPNEWRNIPLWQLSFWMNSHLYSKSLYKHYKLTWMKMYAICSDRDLYFVSKCFYFWVWNMTLFFIFYVRVLFFCPFSFIWVKTSFFGLTNGFLFLLFWNLQIRNLDHFKDVAVSNKNRNKKAWRGEMEGEKQAMIALQGMAGVKVFLMKPEDAQFSSKRSDYFLVWCPY